MPRLFPTAAPAALFVAAALPLLSSPPAPPVEPEGASAAREFFARDVNREREASHLSALRTDRALETLAKTRAAEIAGGAPADPLVGDVLHERAVRAGYDPRFIGEAIIESEGRSPEEIAPAWRPGGGLRSMALRDDVEDLGVGIARRADDADVFVFLFAVSRESLFVRRTQALSDRDALARDMLARVNAERARTGLRPLRLDEHLDRAAQRHAADMLARSFYGHESPDGIGPFQRALAAGYRPTSIGENLADGQYSVEEVMDGWMKSPPHRSQLLDPTYTDVGFGFAHGKDARSLRVVWVQVFGRPK